MSMLICEAGCLLCVDVHGLFLDSTISDGNNLSNPEGTKTKFTAIIVDIKVSI